VDRSNSAYTEGRRHSAPRIPPTQLVDCSDTAYKRGCGSALPKSTNAVGGLFRLSLQKRLRQRSSNPTNAVGGLFRHSLQKRLRQRSPRIPPTQLVDCSDTAYKRDCGSALPKSHQRSWWIVHTQPTAIVFQVRLSYARAVHLEPFKNISWAFQLHYHVCFRTHRRRAVLDDKAKLTAASRMLAELCEVNDIHLIEKDCQSQHVQLLMSLRPTQVIAEAVKKLKGRSSAAMIKEFGLTPPVWARGYLARSTGRVRAEAVKRYLSTQAEHHGYSKRALPPVFKFIAAEPQALTTAHASFELSHHIVLATRFRRGVFGSKTGEALVNYWKRVAAKHGFLVDQATVLPDHVHVLVRTPPKTREVVVSLMNNGQYFVAKNSPLALVEAKIDQLWQPSAYVGTCGELTTALLKAFLRGAA
jgi:putative transposase